MVATSISTSTNKYVFSNILKTGATRGFVSGKTDAALKWYRNAAKSFTSVSRDRLLREKSQIRSSVEPGSMYMFAYEAKHKDTLPFFDVYPLVFPIEFYADGFLGINLHYLPPGARASLLNALMTISNNNKYDDTTKLNISYDLLRSASRRFSGFQNCVKHYLFGHVRSSFQYVHPSDWSKAVTLPLQKWKINTNKRYAGSPPY
jgi:hypothetical protein